MTGETFKGSVLHKQGKGRFTTVWKLQGKQSSSLRRIFLNPQLPGIWEFHHLQLKIPLKDSENLEKALRMRGRDQSDHIQIVTKVVAIQTFLLIPAGQRSHNALLTRGWLQTKRLQPLNWAACRPDLSLTELVYLSRVAGIVFRMSVYFYKQ